MVNNAANLTPDYMARTGDQLSPALPQEWRNSFDSLAVITTSHDQEWVYGEKDGKKIKRLPWGILDEAIEASYGARPLPEPLKPNTEGDWTAQHDRKPAFWDAMIEAGRAKIENYGLKGASNPDVVAELNNRIDALTEAHREELEAREVQHQAQLDGIRRAIDDLRTDFNTRLQTVEEERDTALNQLADAQAEIGRLGANTSSMPNSLNPRNWLAGLRNYTFKFSDFNLKNLLGDLHSRTPKLASLNPKSLLHDWRNRQPAPPITFENDALDSYTPADTAEFDNAIATLAGLTDRRKAHSYLQIRGRKQEKQDYTEALDHFIEQQQQVLEVRRGAAEADQVDPEEIEAAQRAFVFNTRLALANAGRDHSNKTVENAIAKGGFRGHYAKFLRWYAEQPTAGKIGAGAVIGLGGGLLVTSTLGSGLFVVALGSGIKMSLGYLNREANVRNVTDKRLRVEQVRIEKARDQAHRKKVAGAELAKLFSHQEHKETSRHRTINTLGAAAVILGGVVVVDGLAEVSGVHLPHLPSLFSHHGGTHRHSVAPVPRQKVSGSHIDAYNNGPDSRHLTQAELPNNLHLAWSQTDHRIIVDSHGKTVVGDKDLPKHLFNSEGGFSRNAVRTLRAKKYIVKTIPFGKRRMSVVSNG